MKRDPKPIDKDETPEYPLPSPTDALSPEQILPDVNAEQRSARSRPARKAGKDKRPGAPGGSS
ncbi:hypothetical protein [Pseudomonas sp. NFIX28]|jgi:hypothetical protein|uniref:hypothetical protein n=1 Tax=Pseudomonas sp. NFIX28 TaxID=1566235 RepID=UPI0008977768|nr:hypothetical protein [Pseudomonas sp. NFIX28]SDZ31682.1 hypothetical protein SAMN03159453_03213 [Pseudomonas sp. NFIX28]